MGWAAPQEGTRTKHASPIPQAFSAEAGLKCPSHCQKHVGTHKGPTSQISQKVDRSVLPVVCLLCQMMMIWVARCFLSWYQISRHPPPISLEFDALGVSAWTDKLADNSPFCCKRVAPGEKEANQLKKMQDSNHFDHTGFTQYRHVSKPRIFLRPRVTFCHQPFGRMKRSTEQKRAGNK